MRKLFTYFIVVIGACLWSSSASAVLNIYEPFNYSPSALQGNVNNSGVGTANGLTWLQAGTGNPPPGINVTSGSLIGPAELPPGLGNALSITHQVSGDGASNRLALGQNYTQAGALTLYYSFLLNVTDLTNANNVAGAFFFSFNNTGNSSQGTNPTVQPGKMQIRIDPTDGTKYNLAMLGQSAATAGSAAWATTQLDTNTTQFVVGSINLGTKETKLWINPDPNSFNQAAAPSSTVTFNDGTAWSGNNIQSVLMRQHGSLPDLIMDELRVASSWAEVTPAPVLYWDVNGATAGAGGPAPAGTWNSSNTNWAGGPTGPNGDGATQAWSSGFKAIFAAGTDATDPYTVTVDGTQTVGGLAFEDDGIVTLSSGAAGNITITGAATVDVSPGKTAILDVQVSGSNGINKSSTGTLIVQSDAASYSGTTTVSGGTLQLGNGGTTGRLPTGSAIANNGLLTVNRTNMTEQGVDFGGPISGTGNLTQAGSGTLKLTAANTLTGTTRATAGTLLVTHSLALQNSILELEAANAGSVVIDGSLSAATVGALSGTTSPIDLALVNNNSNPLALTVGNNTGVYAGDLSGAGSLTKDGTGAQSITGDNTYTGGTTINSGSLRFGQTISMPATGDVVVKNTGILTVNVGGTGEWTESTDDTIGGTIGGIIKGRGGRGTANQVTWEDGSVLGIDTTNASGTISYTGVIGSFRTTGGGTTNAVGLQKRGAGTLSLDGNNTFTGPIGTAASGGTLVVNTPHLSAGSSMAIPLITIGSNSNLQLGADNVLNPGSLVTSAGAGRLQLLSFQQTIRSLTGTNGVIEVGSGTLTIADQAGDNYTWGQAGGAVVDSPGGGIIRKTGAGTLTLAGAAIPGGNIVNGWHGEFIMENGQLNLSNGSALGQQAQDGRLSVKGGVVSRTNTPTGNYTYNVANVDLHVFDYDLGYDQPDRTSQFSGNTLVNLKEDNVDITIRNTTPLSATTGRFIFLSDIRNLDPNPARGDNPLAVRGITKKGAGILQFSAANTYKGPTKIEAGALLLGGTAATLGDTTQATAVLHLKGGMIATTTTRDSTNAIANALVVDGANSGIGHITTTNGLTSVVMEFNNDSITGTSGSLTISNLNSGTGNTVFRPLFTGSGFNFGLPITISSQTGSGSNIKSNELQSGNSSGTQTFSGPISGGGSFARINAGETILSGANTFTGGTVVSDGTLTVTGTSATFGGGNVSVNAGHAAIASGVANAIANTATLTLLGGGAGGVADIGYMDLAAGVNEQVLSLVLGATTMGNGTYGATGSSAANIFDEYFLGTGIVTVGPAGIPGDFNSDGKVDAGDYVTWRKNNNTNNALANDNGLGTPVGTAHYDLWRANFGNPPGAGASGGLDGAGAVPEPGLLSLVALALGSGALMCGSGLRRRRR